ncbi:16S rRNA (guanine(527)-N(7))-methyltransferase RsmG [bacterium]|nr:16S rRNA (guanine(527)-N(7))-methyltransferase RsmG [bacterium]
MTAIANRQVPDWLNVSRETLDLLSDYLALVEKWNPAINLVAKASLPAAWERHVLDSAQIILQCPDGAVSWVDFGSGGGFPGVIVAAIARETRPDLHVTLVESDKRKATFLSQAGRALGLSLSVSAARAETLAACNADVVSARALAPLSELCSLAHRHLKSDGIAIFPKGAQVQVELEAALEKWRFDWQSLPSMTDPAGRIITMKNIRHV